MGAPGCTPMSQVPLVVAFHLGGRPRCCGCCCSRGKVPAHSGQTSIRQLEEGPSEGYRPYLVSVNRPDLTSGRPRAVQVCLRSFVACG